MSKCKEENKAASLSESAFLLYRTNFPISQKPGYNISAISGFLQNIHIICSAVSPSLIVTDIRGENKFIFFYPHL